MRLRGYRLMICLMIPAVLILAWKCFEAWSGSLKTSVPQVPVPARQLPVDIPIPRVNATANPVQELGNISEKNIFSPERKEFAVAPSSQKQVKPVIRPQVILSGVMISDELKTASIINPGRHLFKGERETKTVHQGELIGDYTLARILPDRIALERAGDSFEVLLYDPRSPKRRSEERTLPRIEAVANVQPTPGASGAVPPQPAAAARVSGAPLNQIQASSPKTAASDSASPKSNTVSVGESNVHGSTSSPRTE